MAPRAKKCRNTPPTRVKTGLPKEDVLALTCKFFGKLFSIKIEKLLFFFSVHDPSMEDNYHNQGDLTDLTDLQYTQNCRPRLGPFSQSTPPPQS